MASRTSLSPASGSQNFRRDQNNNPTEPRPSLVKLNVPKRPSLTPSALFSLILTIREAGRRLGMSDPAIATSCTLFHRMIRVLTVGEETGPFASPDNVVDPPLNVAVPLSPADNPSVSAIDASIRNTLGDVDPYTMAMACLSLGAKMQEEHQRLRDVVVAYYRVLHKAKRPPLEIGEDYDRLRVSLVNAELFLMRLLGFQVRKLDLPHSYLLHYMSALLHWIGKGIAHPPGVDPSATNDTVSSSSHYTQSSLALARLPALAWSILADSYHAPLCVDYAPEYIAASILHLALRIAGVEVVGNRSSEMAWWQAISDTLTREIVEQIQLKVMEVYAVDDRLITIENYRASDFS